MRRCRQCTIAAGQGQRIGPATSKTWQRANAKLYCRRRANIIDVLSLLSRVLCEKCDTVWMLSGGDSRESEHMDV